MYKTCFEKSVITVITATAAATAAAATTTTTTSVSTRVQDLVRLVAYDQQDVHLPMTTFTIIENDVRVPLAIRLEDGKGVVYTLRPLEDRQTYRIKVKAESFDHRRRGVQYETTFMIFISVSSFPY